MDQTILMDLIRRAKDEGSFTVDGDNFQPCVPTDEEILFLASQRVIVPINQPEAHEWNLIFRYVPEDQEYDVTINYIKTYQHTFTVRAKGEVEAEADAMELAANYDFNQCTPQGDYEVYQIIQVPNK